MIPACTYCIIHKLMTKSRTDFFQSVNAKYSLDTLWRESGIPRPRWLCVQRVASISNTVMTLLASLAPVVYCTLYSVYCIVYSVYSVLYRVQSAEDTFQPRTVHPHVRNVNKFVLLKTNKKGKHKSIFNYFYFKGLASRSAVTVGQGGMILERKSLDTCNAHNFKISL